MRYLLKTMMEFQAHIAATGEKPDPTAPKPDRPLTVIEALYGPDLSRLRRPKNAPEATHAWEIDPQAFDHYMVAGDWREPFRAPSHGSGTEAGRR